MQKNTQETNDSLGHLREMWIKYPMLRKSIKFLADEIKKAKSIQPTNKNLVNDAEESLL